MRKKLKIAIIIVLVFIVLIAIALLLNKNDEQLQSVKSAKQLSKMYEGDDNTSEEIFLKIFTLPYSILSGIYYSNASVTSTTSTTSGGISLDDLDTTPLYSSSASISTNSIFSSTKSSSKDYSTTNIQVENVDEADITKTDGDYIYSISDSNVIITNVQDPKDVKISATIKNTDGSIPEDMVLYNDKLVVILSKEYNSSSYNSNTVVKIYDINDKTNPTLVKNYELYEPYYTSRCINGKLYVIASGNLRKDGDNVITYYKENNTKKEIALENIKYLKDVSTDVQSIITMTDLNDIEKDINISSYLMDISNAYVSENNIYLLNQKYGNGKSTTTLLINKLFGIKGILGYVDYRYGEEDDSYGYYTDIYKFNILEDGNISYDTKTKIKGKTINQYSLDELDGHLRIALYDSDGARVVILDDKLDNIGTSEYVAKGETMYSSRFIGNKVYLVTYKTMDPLFVIDLSDETKPTVLGELKIPGYSTYLHPYDETHIIGIGMETTEKVNRNSSGKVTSTTSTITGMKMALFDVSDVNNPIQISSTVIGDRKTTSAILTNSKALLFSKEKELIAIPVNNYTDDFEVSSSNDTYSSLINSYKNYSKEYNSEGYFVYKINVEDGFKLKGVITHDVQKTSSYSYYSSNSKLLRGIYIDDNLFTVSETALKVNNLETLDLISELKIK